MDVWLLSKFEALAKTGDVVTRIRGLGLVLRV